MEPGAHIDEILAGCRKGDRKAQERLYKNFYHSMVTICLRYTGNDQDAVEVLNRGFLKVFKHIEKFEAPRAQFYTWIRTIMIHCCLDHVKASRKKEQHLELHEATEHPVEPEAISKIKTAALIELVTQLPKATGMVFNLFVMEGYSHKEIASLLDISEGTSKWHLSEARKMLQTMVQQKINVSV